MSDLEIFLWGQWRILEGLQGLQPRAANFDQISGRQNFEIMKKFNMMFEKNINSLRDRKPAERGGGGCVSRPWRKTYRDAALYKQ